MAVFEDLTGKKIGYLTVLHRVPDWIQPSGQHKRMWHCVCQTCGMEKNIVAGQLKASKNLCDCGNENELSVSETALHSGLKKTCGHAEDIKVSSDKKCEELSRNTKFISLAEKYPELAKEWNTVRNDKLSPENVASGSFDFDSKKG